MESQYAINLLPAVKGKPVYSKINYPVATDVFNPSNFGYWNNYANVDALLQETIVNLKLVAGKFYC
jgi:hypothetical protein